MKAHTKDAVGVRVGLSSRATTILRLIAAGQSYERILGDHPHLTRRDIRSAAADALGVIECEPAMHRSKRRHLRAYERWLPEEENQLRRLIVLGHSAGDIAAQLQRQPSVIGSRTRRLGLVIKSVKAMSDKPL